MNIVGVDVGFARDRRTSGVAHLGIAGLTLGCATADWADRKRVLGSVGGADVTAIDAPVVPDLEHGHRTVERLLSGGLFQRRCKPGASHVPGTGLELRRAGRETATQFASVTSERPLPREVPRVWSGTNLVEAFPNAFLGVCVPDDKYRNMPKLRRGKKFDWLYDQWCGAGLFSKLAEFIGLEGRLVADACQSNRHHEERAALVCLLTAASVASGKYAAAGDKLGGYIFLPPMTFWAAWAQEELYRQQRRLADVDVWIDGALSA